MAIHLLQTRTIDSSNYSLGETLIDFYAFITIFSFFNDDFIVVNLGENMLKTIFVVFMLLNYKTIFSNLTCLNSIDKKLFINYYVLLFFIFSIQVILNRFDDVITAFFPFLYLAFIVAYFRSYNLQKILYFIWISMIVSVVICFFNKPIIYSFRTSGGTGDPNEFATQLLIFILVSFHLFKKNKNKLFIFISILFFTYGLFKAGSMSSFIVLFIIISLFVYKERNWISKRIFKWEGFIFLVAVILLVSYIDFTKIEGVQNILGRTQDTHTKDQRIQSWIAGSQMIMDNPLIGVGMGEYAETTKIYSETAMADTSRAAHNIYILLFAESGIIVGISFIILLLYLIKSYHKNDDYMFIWLSFVSILLMGLTLGLTYDKYFILMIAISMNVLDRIREDASF